MRAAVVATLVLAVACAAVPGMDDAIEPITVPKPGAGFDQLTVPTPPPATGPARPSWGCTENPDVTPFDGTRTVAAENGKPREMLLHVPAGLPPEPVPLVLDFHGLGTNAEFQASATKWNELADQERFIVAHPQGNNNVWEFALSDANPDIAFAKAAVFNILVSRCVDTSRIYATGLSMGGLLASALACKSSDVFAAVGLVAGMQYKPECEGTPVRPAVVFWGSLDCVLPWFGTLGPCLAIGGPGRTQPTAPVPPEQDGGFPPVEKVLADWAAHNGCGTEPHVRSVSAAITHQVYTGCQPGGDVELYYIDGGGHTWPGSELLANADTDPAKIASRGGTTREIDATAIIWDFFKRYQLNP